MQALFISMGLWNKNEKPPCYTTPFSSIKVPRCHEFLMQHITTVANITDLKQSWKPKRKKKKLSDAHFH